MKRKFYSATFSLAAAIFLTFLAVNTSQSGPETNNNCSGKANIEMVKPDKSKNSCPYLNNNSCDYLQKAKRIKCPAFNPDRSDRKSDAVKITML